jgi:hypothetical protein
LTPQLLKPFVFTPLVVCCAMLEGDNQTRLKIQGSTLDQKYFFLKNLEINKNIYIFQNEK